MPELPEVETVARTLEHQLDRMMITGCKVFRNNIIDYPDTVTLCKDIIRKTIQGHYRHGRCVRFDPRDTEWVYHTRMERELYVQQPQELHGKHVHVILQLSDGRQLRYHDTRKFSKVYLYEKHTDVSSYLCFRNVGYDVFDERVTAEWVHHTLHKKGIALKAMLLDQRYIAGIGNIYADEICFAVHMHPETMINHLRKKDFEKLVYHIRRILDGAIYAGGMTTHSYTSQLGMDDRFQLRPEVHAKKGEACPVYKTKIEKIVVATRGACSYPICQRRR